MKDTAGHPHYRPAHITCACGAVHDTFSTRGDFGVDICSNCHPFFTGKQKLIDTAGRIDRFTKRYAKKTCEPARRAAASRAMFDTPSFRDKMATLERRHEELGALLGTAEVIGKR